MDSFQLSWADFKTLIDTWSIKSLIRFVPKDGNGVYLVIWVEFQGQIFQCLRLSDPADVADFETNYKPETLVADAPKLVAFQNVTPDNRSILAVNRTPPGYTVYHTGAGDHIANNTYGNGDDVVLTQATPTKTMQFLNHFYAIGGRIVWESASLANYVDAWLVAPASQGWTNAAGDFDKVALGGPYNKLKPVAAGTGAWNVDLAAKIGSTSILKSTPVPSPGNTGWFDYNSDTNVITPNLAQKGGYDLYDFDVNLFKFVNRIWGRKMDGAESVYEATDVVGKLLYNTWKIKFTLTTAEGTATKAGISLTIAAKKNL